MVELQSGIESLHEAGIELVAISYDEPKLLAKFAKKRKITFPLLSDPASKTIDAYGLRNLEVAGSRVDGIPHPGIVMLDQNGRVRTKLFYEGYKARYGPGEILEAAEGWPEKVPRDP